MTVDRNPAGGRVSLSEATRVLSARKSYRTSDPVRQARTDLAELMANGCPSISEAARTMRITQSRCDQHWQAIKRELGVEQCK
jgi:hypothetical protein